jgi:hypothetical protein
MVRTGTSTETESTLVVARGGDERRQKMERES